MKTLAWLNAAASWTVTVIVMFYWLSLCAYDKFDAIYPTWMKGWTNDKVALVWMLGLLVLAALVCWIGFSLFWYKNEKIKEAKRMKWHQRLMKSVL